MEVGLHQGSAFSPFLFAIMMDSLTENIRKEAPWQMMFADDVVLWARRAGVGTGAVDGSLGEERNKSVKSKDRVYVSEWNDIRK